ncbi:MAG: DsbA family protein [Pseudomonadota bacterium]
MSVRRLLPAVFLGLLVLAASFSVSHAEDAMLSADKLKALNTPPSMGDKMLGKADAPVTIIEYASLTCSHCADFHKDVLPKLKQTYIDTGKVKLIFRGFSLNPLDTAAQMLTQCAPQDKYFPLVSAFFTTQKTWALAEDPVAALLQVAKQAGFTKESFETCLRNQKLLDEINAVRDKASKEIGVASTPTLFVNGQMHKGALTFDALEKLILTNLKS